MFRKRKHDAGSGGGGGGSSSSSSSNNNEASAATANVKRPRFFSNSNELILKFCNSHPISLTQYNSSCVNTDGVVYRLRSQTKPDMIENNWYKVTNVTDVSYKYHSMHVYELSKDAKFEQKPSLTFRSSLEVSRGLRFRLTFVIN